MTTAHIHRNVPDIPFVNVTSLDKFDKELHSDQRSFKLVGTVQRSNNPHQTEMKCEYAEDRTKWGKFKDWLTHTFVSNVTQRDVLKYENTHSIVNSIRNDLRHHFPELDTYSLNAITDYVVDNATNGKIRAITMDRSGRNIPENTDMDIGYSTTRAHAMNDEEITRANEILHRMILVGVEPLSQGGQVHHMDIDNAIEHGSREDLHSVGRSPVHMRKVL